MKENFSFKQNLYVSFTCMDENENIMNVVAQINIHLRLRCCCSKKLVKRVVKRSGRERGHFLALMIKLKDCKNDNI